MPETRCKLSRQFQIYTQVCTNVDLERGRCSDVCGRQFLRFLPLRPNLVFGGHFLGIRRAGGGRYRAGFLSL